MHPLGRKTLQRQKERRNAGLRDKGNADGKGLGMAKSVFLNDEPDRWQEALSAVRLPKE